MQMVQSPTKPNPCGRREHEGIGEEIWKGWGLRDGAALAVHSPQQSEDHSETEDYVLFVPHVLTAWWAQVADRIEMELSFRGSHPLPPSMHFPFHFQALTGPGLLRCIGIVSCLIHA